MMNKIKFENKKIKKLILIAFALSGMCALIYEVVWARPLQLIFGSTIYAVSTMLTTFFIGFALGSYIFRNLADKAKEPLKTFALLEFGIGLYGFIILWLFKIMPSIYLNIDNIEGMLGIQFVKFFAIFLILIAPATLFGATWPVVNKAYISPDKLGKDAGLLYYSNSFGSFIGPLAAGFLLIPVLGIKSTSIFAAFVNILIAAAIFIFSKNMKEVKNEA